MAFRLPAGRVWVAALGVLGWPAAPPGCNGALPPGGAPFAAEILPQPVAGAPRDRAASGGRLCNISSVPYSAANGSNATEALQRAIDDCGGLPHPGGTVLVPAGLHLWSASLWLRSNLTLRVEGQLQPG